MSERVGIIRVSMELLGQLLHLPEHHIVRGVRPSSASFDEFEVLCEGPSIPESCLSATPVLSYEVGAEETGNLVREKSFTGRFRV